jgi:iron(III) transport system permease protein
MSVAARRTGARRGPPLALTAGAVLVAALALLPLAYLVIRGLEGGAGAWAVVLRPRTLELVWRTLLLVGAVTATATALGVALAWLVMRTDVPGRRAWAVGAALPLVIPSYVTALTLIASLGPGGLVGEALGGAGSTWLFGLPGAWLALTFATYPYVFLLTAAALRRLDPALEEAARGLGRSRGAAFGLITLPLLRPSIGAGAVLVALYTLSDFGVVSLMRYDALTRAIFQQYRSLFDRTPAAILGLVLVALTALVLALEWRTRGRGLVRRGAAGADRPAAPVVLGAWRRPAVALLATVVALALVAPLGVLAYWIRRGAADALSLDELVSAGASSLLVSGLAAAGAAAAALPVAALAARWPARWTAGLERASYAANALPGVVIALALVFFATRLAEPLYQTLAVLVLAYVIRFLPQALAGAHGAFARVDPRLEHAARGLGVGPARAFARVTAPLLAPGVLAGAMLVLLSTMKELPATLLLRPLGFDTLATEVWSATSVASYSRAALPALALVVLSAPVVWLLQVLRQSEPPEPAPE